MFSCVGGYFGIFFISTAALQTTPPRDFESLIPQATSPKIFSYIVAGSIINGKLMRAQADTVS